MNRKSVVIFGGGNGMSQVLRGLKLFPLDITAVVSVSDNGGSSGVLTRLNQIPAIGDLRKVFGAMSENKDLEDLLNYRFYGEPFKNHPLGNIILLALYEINGGSLDKSVKDLNSIFKIDGLVLPVTNQKVDLCAITNNGNIIGEDNVNKYAGNIIKLKNIPDISVNTQVIEKVSSADMIVFSPGSLYTSTLACLCYDDLIYEIKKSKAKKIYISNIMTEPNETLDFKLSDHINAIKNILNIEIDGVICNNNYKFDSNVILEYNKKGSKIVECDYDSIDNQTSIYSANLVEVSNGHIKHDSLRLAMLLFQIIYQG